MNHLVEEDGGPPRAAVIEGLERDLKQEWDKHRDGLWAIFTDLESRTEELDVTVEIDAGVTKLAIEAHFNRPSPVSATAPP